LEIIALSGFARSGKDEAAKVLVNEFGFTRVAFADKLREVLYALDPIVLGREMKWHGEEGYSSGVWSVQSVIDEYGWDHYKETPFGWEIRRLLQRLGTEAGRQTLWDSIWIDAAFANLANDAKVVVSDARFINEFEAVKARGGKIWRIDRPGVGPANEHPSEMEATTYKDFDKYLVNNGTLERWHEVVANVYKKRESVFTS
jgi:hypothetical protein